MLGKNLPVWVLLVAVVSMFVIGLLAQHKRFLDGVQLGHHACVCEADQARLGRMPLGCEDIIGKEWWK